MVIHIYVHNTNNIVEDYFFLSHAFLRRRRKKALIRVRNRRILGTVYSRLKIHVGSKIDLEIGAHSHFHLLYMMKRAGML